jgi:hypothetical protein
MAKIFIRKVDQDPSEILKNQVVPAIKNGTLLADDEISPDGQFWVRLGQHKQLGALFNYGAAKTQPSDPAKPKQVSESTFYSSDRVNCPKCGFEQDRGDACENCNVFFEKYWNLKKERAKKKPHQIIEPELDSIESKSFVKKLWTGEYPLWVTYWLFGVVSPGCVFFILWSVFAGKIMVAAEGMMNESPLSESMMSDMKFYATWYAVFMLVFLAYSFIVNVGLWRSASNYAGTSIWSIIVKFFVIVFFITLPFNIFGAFGFLEMTEEVINQIEERGIPAVE